MHSVTGAYRVVAGRYQLLERIGSGGVGTVWRARDLVAGLDVAVKEVRIPGLASERDRRVLRERSVREARVAARLSHPAIVPVYDVIDAEGRPWIVMELVAARSLSRALAEDGPMSPLRAAEIGTNLVGALTSAHAAGIVHRDVKPGNVLLADGGRVLLSDFGIATLEGDPGLTQVGMVIGTPGFCAPERIRGEPASAASDLWSLGATLYAAVAGHGPFDREGSLMAVLAGIVHGEPSPPPSAGPLAPVIAALMTRDPCQRPDAATAGRLLAAVVAGEAAWEPPPVGRHASTQEPVSAAAPRATGTTQWPVGGMHERFPGPPPASPPAPRVPDPAPRVPDPVPAQPFVAQPFLGRHSRGVPPPPGPPQPSRLPGRLGWSFRPGRHRRAGAAGT